MEGIDGILGKLITSGKYDGIDYVKDNPQIKRNRLFENILLGFERHTKINPTLLCIEDLHWADPSSLALMHYVARNTRKSNLLILGTYRPEDISITRNGEVHHLIETMQMMNREDLLQKIELERLKKEQMEEMLASFFEKSNFPSEFHEQLYRETEGNPFFIKSLIRMLIEEGTIVYKDDIWILTRELREANIPSKVYDVVIRRLYRVKEKQREILEYAAVMGEEFSSDVLIRTTGLNKIELLKELRTLEQNHKLIRSIEPKYKFDHAKIKEVLNSQIPSDLKREYHEAIAESIEAIYKEQLDKVNGDLAYHFYNGANKERALPYLIKLGEKAKNEYSNEEGIKFLKQALEFEEEDQKRADLFEKLGDIYRINGDYDKSIESFKSSANLTNSKKKKIRLLSRVGLVYGRKGDFKETLRFCTQATKIIESEEYQDDAFLLMTRGGANIRLGNNEIAFNDFEKCLEIAQNIGDQKEIAYAYNALGFGAWYSGDYEQIIALEMKCLEIWEKMNNHFGISNTYLNLCFAYGRQGNYKKAIELGERAKDISLKINNQSSLAHCFWGLAEAYYVKSDLGKALEYTNQAFKLSTRINCREVIAESHPMFGIIYGKQRKWKESIKNFEKSFKIFKDMGMKMELGDTNYQLGLMLKKKGDVDNAKEHLNNARDIYGKLKLQKHLEKVRKELQSCQ